MFVYRNSVVKQLAIGRSVRMRVVGVRIVRVGVRQGFMPMTVRMSGSRGDRLIVSMPMMFVVHVLMLVFHRLVRMLVLVPFGDMQPDANPHQHCRQGKGDIHRVTKECHGDQRAHEWRSGEVRASSSGPQMTQRDDEKHEA